MKSFPFENPFGTGARYLRSPEGGEKNQKKKLGLFRCAHSNDISKRVVLLFDVELGGMRDLGHSLKSHPMIWYRNHRAKVGEQHGEDMTKKRKSGENALDIVGIIVDFRTIGIVR
jgi:hypothetical protein